MKTINSKHLLQKRTLVLAIAAATAMGLTACEVEQTEETRLPEVDVEADEGQLPSYDVDVTKTQDGEMPSVDVDVEGGNMAEYDVDTADVEVGSKTVDVKVPDVDVEMEEREVTVPTVEVEMPGEDEPDEDDDSR